MPCAVLFIVPALLDWYAARLCGKRSLDLKLRLGLKNEDFGFIIITH